MLGLADVKRVGSWLVPEGAILAAVVLALRVGLSTETLRAVALLYPYAVFGLGLLLALRFQRSRLVFALLVVGLAHWALLEPPVGRAGRFVFQATAFLVPLNLAAITLTTEPGTFSRRGFVRLAALLLQVGAVVGVARFAPDRGAALAAFQPLPGEWFGWTPLTQLPVFASLAAFGLTAMGVLLLAAPTGRAFLWALVATFLGFHVGPTNVAQTIYLGTAGLILIVAVIETSHLLAYQDGLTGLPARRALTEALPRLDGPYTVAMVDIDRFKKLNDRYGHDVGDQVLRMVGAKLANAPGGGQAFRYGGEEFAVLFPGKTADDCLPDLEALRKEIEATRFTIRRRLRPRRKPAKVVSRGTRRTLTITVSIGAAEPNGRRKTPDQVIKAADRALYQAKEAGRNRVRS